MLPKREDIINPFSLDDANTLSDILQKVQNECYRLLPEKIKQQVALGDPIGLTRGKLGYNLGHFPYPNRKALLKSEAKYSRDAACLLYESFVLLNRSGIANKQWDQESSLTFLVAISTHIGFENANNIKNFLLSLADEKKRIPLAINDATNQLAVVLKAALEKIVRNNLLPVTSDTVKVQIDLFFSKMISELSRTIFEYQTTVEPQQPLILEPLPEVSFLNDDEEAEKEVKAEEKQALQFEILPDYKQAPAEQPIHSDIFKNILHDMLDNSWSSRAFKMMNNAKLFAIGMNISAFASSLSVYFQAQKFFNGTDVFSVYMALLPNDAAVLNSISVKLTQIMDRFETGSRFVSDQSFVLAAATAKLVMLKDPNMKPQDEFVVDRAQLNLVMPKIESAYVYHQHLLYLSQGADIYYEELLAKIREQMTILDPTDAYYFIVDEKINIDPETKEEVKITRNVDFVDAILRDYRNKDANTLVMQFAEKDATFRQLLAKFDVMSTLVSDLKDQGKTPQNRVLQFHKDLRDNYSVLNTNRDSGATTFIKLVGFVLSTFILPVIGNYLFYSRFFVSQGCRYASQALHDANPIVDKISDIAPPQLKVN